MNTAGCAIVGALLGILVVAGTQAVVPDVQGAVIGSAAAAGALCAFVGFYFGRGSRPPLAPDL